MNSLLAKGLEHHRRGELVEAESCYRTLLEVEPAAAQVLSLLGQLLRAQGKSAEALECFGRAVVADPKSIEAHTGRGNLLRAFGRFAEAIESHRQAIELSPTDFRGWSNLGITFLEAKHYAAAEEMLRHALTLERSEPELLFNLGNVFLATQRFDEACRFYERTLEAASGHVRALTNLGVAHKEAGRFDEGRTALERACAANPTDADAQWNLGLLHLLLGDYSRGFELYEWRRSIPSIRIQSFAQPCWDGASFEGRTLLVHFEQGLGDLLQFVRFLPLAKRRGGRVVFQCQASLTSLLSGMAGVDELCSTNEPLPKFELQAPLMSLPHLLGVTRETLPPPLAYAPASAERLARWTERLGGRGRAGELKVGLCWQGNPRHRGDLRRSVPLEALLPVLQKPGLQFYSLQKEQGLEQLAQLPQGLAIESLDPELDREGGAFVDTACVAQLLDVVLTVDTAIAHVANTAGANTWVMLSSVPDWRWGARGDASPWYPSARLFRQKRPGDWSPVVEQVCEALAQLRIRSGSAM